MLCEFSCSGSSELRKRYIDKVHFSLTLTLILDSKKDYSAKDNLKAGRYRQRVEPYH